MVDYTIINGGAASYDNVNAGSDDVPAQSALVATLTSTELLACLNDDANIAVMDSGATAAEKLAVANAILAHVGAAALTANAATMADGFATFVDANCAAVDLSDAAAKELFRLKSSLEELEAIRDLLVQ